MKKVFLMLVMLFTMSVVTFADDSNANNVEEIEKYDLNVNTRKLAEYLQLTSDQMDAVEVVTSEFEKDLMFVALECANANRSKVTKNVIAKNLKHMSYILNEKQYHKYLAVLNATIINRGIEY